MILARYEIDENNWQGLKTEEEVAVMTEEEAEEYFTSYAAWMDAEWERRVREEDKQGRHVQTIMWVCHSAKGGPYRRKGCLSVNIRTTHRFEGPELIGLAVCCKYCRKQTLFDPRMRFQGAGRFTQWRFEQRAAAEKRADEWNQQRMTGWWA